MRYLVSINKSNFSYYQKSINKRGWDLRMIDKNFIILNEYEDETTLEEKVVEFLKYTFGELVLDKIYVEVCSYIIEEPTWTDVIDIIIEFNEYKYFNKVHGECVESICITLEDKGFKPFYIKGKFVSLRVFEWTQALPIQKTEMVYGIHKDKIYKDFSNYILTC